jgi:hypothetical protein
MSGVTVVDLYDDFSVRAYASIFFSNTLPFFVVHSFWMFGDRLRELTLAQVTFVSINDLYVHRCVFKNLVSNVALCSFFYGLDEPPTWPLLTNVTLLDVEMPLVDGYTVPETYVILTNAPALWSPI